MNNNSLVRIRLQYCLWICMHYCNTHPSKGLRGGMVQIKNTVSAKFIKGYFCNFYVNRLLSVEKMCGTRMDDGMQSICSWLISWGQRIFKVITFTVAGQQSALGYVNGNIPTHWKFGWWDLLKIEVDFKLISVYFSKFHRFNLDFYFLSLFWKNRVDDAYVSNLCMIKRAWIYMCMCE